MTARLDVRDGKVYLTAAVAGTYFQGIETVIVLIHEGALRILPVSRATGGGCLLKVRNPGGDRVVVTPDVFREHGLEAWSAEGLEATWSSEQGALVAPLPEEVIAN